MSRALFPALLGITVARWIGSELGLAMSWYGPILAVVVTCAWAKLKQKPAALANFPHLQQRREANV